jgi:hypothetical protein
MLPNIAEIGHKDQNGQADDTHDQAREPETMTATVTVSVSATISTSIIAAAKLAVMLRQEDVGHGIVFLPSLFALSLLDLFQWNSQ